MTISVISHTACLMLGGSIGFVFAAICAMASDKYPQGRCDCRGATAEDQIVSDQARLTSLPPRMAPLLRMSDNESPSRRGFKDGRWGVGAAPRVSCIRARSVRWCGLSNASPDALARLRDPPAAFQHNRSVFDDPVWLAFQAWPSGWA